MNGREFLDSAKRLAAQTCGEFFGPERADWGFASGVRIDSLSTLDRSRRDARLHAIVPRVTPS